MNPPPQRPWETPRLQNNAQVLRNDAYAGPSGLNGVVRSAPVLPPRPQSSLMGGGYSSYGSYNSYMPYSGKSLPLIYEVANFLLLCGCAIFFVSGNEIRLFIAFRLRLRFLWQPTVQELFV